MSESFFARTACGSTANMPSPRIWSAPAIASSSTSLSKKSRKQIATQTCADRYYLRRQLTAGDQQTGRHRRSRRKDRAQRRFGDGRVGSQLSRNRFQTSYSCIVSIRILPGCCWLQRIRDRRGTGSPLSTRRRRKRISLSRRGRLASNEGKIDFPLPGREGNPVRALTRFHVSRQFSETTLVRVKIETGRLHQIRLHFASWAIPS